MTRNILTTCCTRNSVAYATGMSAQFCSDRKHVAFLSEQWSCSLDWKFASSIKQNVRPATRGRSSVCVDVIDGTGRQAAPGEAFLQASCVAAGDVQGAVAEGSRRTETGWSGIARGRCFARVRFDVFARSRTGHVVISAICAGGGKVVVSWRLGL